MTKERPQQEPMPHWMDQLIILTARKLAEEYKGKTMPQGMTKRTCELLAEKLQPYFERELSYKSVRNRARDYGVAWRGPQKHQQKPKRGAWTDRQNRFVRMLWMQLGWPAGRIAEHLVFYGYRSECNASIVAKRLRSLGLTKNNRGEQVTPKQIATQLHKLGVKSPHVRSLVTEDKRRKRKRKTKRSAEPKAQPHFIPAPGLTFHSRREVVVRLSADAVRNAIVEAIGGSVRVGPGEEPTFTDVQVDWDGMEEKLVGATVQVEIRPKEDI